VIERLFGEEALRRIEASVREAEARSHGEVVPVAVERSAAYGEARVRGALLGAVAATAAALVLDLPLPPAELALLQVLAGLAAGLAALLGPVERVLAGRAGLDAAVRDRAVRAFQEHGLHRTERGTGVLVFASLRERRAVVLGDHGIHDKVGDAAWQAAVDRLVAGMGRGDPAGGFCEAIALVGAGLAEHFPRGALPDGNELPDRLHLDR
jgi:putative membrane protein